VNGRPLRTRAPERRALPALLVALAAAGPHPVVTRAHREIVDGALAMDAYRFDRRAG